MISTNLSKAKPYVPKISLTNIFEIVNKYTDSKL